MICTAMVQVDACGFVVCGKPAVRDRRCSEHATTHAVEKMTTLELFDAAVSRLRTEVANEWWDSKRVAMVNEFIGALEEERCRIVNDLNDDEKSLIPGLERAIQIIKDLT